MDITPPTRWCCRRRPGSHAFWAGSCRFLNEVSFVIVVVIVVVAVAICFFFSAANCLLRALTLRHVGSEMRQVLFCIDRGMRLVQTVSQT
jgi:hypothetical protein